MFLIHKLHYSVYIAHYLPASNLHTCPFPFPFSIGKQASQATICPSLFHSCTFLPVGLYSMVFWNIHIISYWFFYFFHQKLYFSDSHWFELYALYLFCGMLLSLTARDMLLFTHMQLWIHYYTKKYEIRFNLYDSKQCHLKDPFNTPSFIFVNVFLCFDTKQELLLFSFLFCFFNLFT